MNVSSDQPARDGAAIYNKLILSIYDLWVIKFSNQFAWRCPARIIEDFYNKHISTNHLDVGVGTGYFLDRCRFPDRHPRIALLDLNPNSLAMTAARLHRYHPTTHLGNVLEPIQINVPKFDSIALNYLLHCLPGTMQSKYKVFEHLQPWLSLGGIIFGSTILGSGVNPNTLARRLMTIYNDRYIFSNRQDTLEDLEAILKRHFEHISIEVVGCVAFFTGQISANT